MDKIMFDSNIFDRLPGIIDTVKQSTEEYRYYITSIQVEELCEIPDDKIEKRTTNMLMLVDIRATLIPLSVIVCSRKLRLGYAWFGNGIVYNKVLNKSRNNVEDALIADTAVCEGCTLITEDKELYAKMKSNDYKVMFFDDFASELKMKYPISS